MHEFTQNRRQKTWRNPACWLTHLLMVSQRFNTSEAHLLTDGIAHSRLGPPHQLTILTANSPQTYPQPNLIWAISQWRVTSNVTPGYVKLRVDSQFPGTYTPEGLVCQSNSSRFCYHVAILAISLFL